MSKVLRHVWVLIIITSSCNVLRAEVGNWWEETVELDWWQKTVIYQIYPRSFKDSNGDGIGDIPGIIEHLDHFSYIGVDTLWLSPVYESPMRDYGYDVSNFTNIDPIFGTLDDFDDLIEEMHRKKMRLLMDFIPNHSSSDHAWFKASQQSADNPYSEYYCWHDGKLDEQGKRVPPNNWLTVFGGSAWTWNENRQQYYLHQYLPSQPDLNYRSMKVRQEMKDVLEFWLDRGVDGFRVDAIQVLFEDERLLDEMPSGDPSYSPSEYFYLRHDYTVEQPEVHEVVREWRDLFEKRRNTEDGKYILMVSEGFTVTLNESSPQSDLFTTKTKLDYYKSGADFPFNFYLFGPDEKCGGNCFRRYIDVWMKDLEPGMWPNYVLGNHDTKRITTRKGQKYASALNVLLLMLPGTPTTYYGEELALKDIKVKYNETKDPWGINAGKSLYKKYSRDPCRSPMPWTSNKNAGFTKAHLTPWLPLNRDYRKQNVDLQMVNSTGCAPLQVYRLASYLRKQPSFLSADHVIQYAVVNDDILSFVRSRPGYPVFLIALHLGTKPHVQVDFKTALSRSDEEDFMGEIEVIANPMKARKLDDKKKTKKLKLHRKINPNEVVFEPGDAIVLKLMEVEEDYGKSKESKQTENKELKVEERGKDEL